MTGESIEPVGSTITKQLPKYCQFYNNEYNEFIHNKLIEMRKHALKSQLIKANELIDLELNYILKQQTPSINKLTKKSEHDVRMIFITITAICALIAAFNYNFIDFLFGIRCFLPNNYLIWEATRPMSDCQFCIDIQKPVILRNITRESFAKYAYKSQPIIIKNAFEHWPAKEQLTYQFLKQLYQKYPNELERFDEECQFLPFESSFGSLREFFEMPIEQIESGKPTWYIGFSNCQLNILAELRQLYQKPHFLPEDAELSNTDYIFLGYDDGAVIHLDYIPRLMWQAQLQGTKSWIVSPTPECESKCSSFTFYVEPSDAVLIDTRIWYHGTSVKPGQFSMTIQSEYG